jgi:uncharacterized protein (DUF1330 family)
MKFWKGPQLKKSLSSEFPTHDEAKAAYQSPEYQAACKHRFQAGDYGFIITEGKA